LQRKLNEFEFISGIWPYLYKLYRKSKIGNWLKAKNSR
jgi:hypothetical protein